jgi:hypothetical protein
VRCCLKKIKTKNFFNFTSQFIHYSNRTLTNTEGVSLSGLILHSLMPNDAENLFISAFAISVCSLVKSVLMSFAHVLIGLFVNFVFPGY